MPGVSGTATLENAVSNPKVSVVWADWLVCEVHHEPDRHGRIASVRVRPDLGQAGLGDMVEYSRNEVLRRLGRGETFATIYEDDNRQWNYGAPILAERHGGTGLGGQPFFYLRTVADGVRRDNLGELPTY